MRKTENLLVNCLAQMNPRNPSKQPQKPKPLSLLHNQQNKKFALLLMRCHLSRLVLPIQSP